MVTRALKKTLFLISIFGVLLSSFSCSSMSYFYEPYDQEFEYNDSQYNDNSYDEDTNEYDESPTVWQSIKRKYTHFKRWAYRNQEDITDVAKMVAFCTAVYVSFYYALPWVYEAYYGPLDNQNLSSVPRDSNQTPHIPVTVNQQYQVCENNHTIYQDPVAFQSGNTCGAHALKNSIGSIYKVLEHQDADAILKHAEPLLPSSVSAQNNWTQFDTTSSQGIDAVINHELSQHGSLANAPISIFQSVDGLDHLFNPIMAIDEFNQPIASPLQPIIADYQNKIASQQPFVQAFVLNTGESKTQLNAQQPYNHWISVVAYKKSQDAHVQFIVTDSNNMDYINNQNSIAIRFINLYRQYVLGEQVPQ